MEESAGSELAVEYRLRFAQHADYRRKVWQELYRVYFHQFIRKEDAVLDLGCGWGEFINVAQATKKYGMDLNPESAKILNPDITFLHQDCSTTWPLPANSLDVVFTSNFFEHLPSKQHLSATVKEAWRSLRPGGVLICMGPNIRYAYNGYWDFFDHYLPLSDRAMQELMRMTGFTQVKVIRKFLPYTMSQGWHPPLFAVRAYISVPWLWPIFGKQFLVIATK
jgi:SAM-dependent methyltransferase